MQQADLPILKNYEVIGDFLFSSGFIATHNLLKLPEPPEAIFCSNDAMAIGAYQAIYQCKLQVGIDIAIIGYDDIELAQYMTPTLTTIHQPKQEFGRLAVTTLIARCSEPMKEKIKIILEPILIKRMSS